VASRELTGTAYIESAHRRSPSVSDEVAAAELLDAIESRLEDELDREILVDLVTLPKKECGREKLAERHGVGEGRVRTSLRRIRQAARDVGLKPPEEGDEEGESSARSPEEKGGEA
jgi:predicted transcriptional regulator